MKKGFTLIELILVIAILGILAIASLPKYFDTFAEAKHVSMNGVVGSVRAGIALYRSNDMVTSTSGTGSYPATLDSAASSACSGSNLCFTTVLSGGVDDLNWAKTSATTYTFNNGVSIITFTYLPANGTFSD